VAKLSRDEFANFFVYFKNLPHQAEAVKELYDALAATAPSHVQDTAPWVRTYRTAPEPEVQSVINDAGVDLIKRWEGLRLEAYLCPAGVPTVGYGHTGEDVWMGMTITEPEAETLLRKDLWSSEDTVSNAVQATLTDNEYAALVSFVFNCGAGAFKSSTLLRRINSGENVGTVIQEEFPRWVYGGGQKLQGLVNRRNDEIKLALS
jgi:GH24 family phage-related lysozyme (muramidase)